MARFKKLRFTKTCYREFSKAEWAHCSNGNIHNQIISNLHGMSLVPNADHELAAKLNPDTNEYLLHHFFYCNQKSMKASNPKHGAL
jgi:hypothetical protein